MSTAATPALSAPPPSAATARGPLPVVRVLTGDGSPVCECCELADTFLARLRGLMGRRRLATGGGMLLRPAGSVHTCFMRFPIDVVVLDRELRVLSVVHQVRPWRTAGSRRGRAVLELAAGEARRTGIRAGDVLTFETPEAAV
jgi:uncharacterized protein